MPPRPDDLESELPALARRIARSLLADQTLDPRDAGSRPSGVHVSLDPRRPGAAGSCRGPAPAADKGRPLVTVEALAGIADGAELAIEHGSLVTPLAREEAARRGIRLSEALSVRVAIAADHGGLALKRTLVAHLRARGLELEDLGTHDEGPVDYPDQAAAVAREVASGRATVGIAIDGAGIGSAMAVNRVPGARAAACYSAALAKNAREHNHANVLTLGAGHTDADTARSIVDTFLATPFGPERHARRVAKITALETDPWTSPR
jgi:ribose 5-phosphate isomerase B